MTYPSYRHAISILALAIAVVTYPLHGALAQQQMGSGMMNQGAMNQGMMGNQGMTGPGMMGSGAMGMGCPAMADGGMMPGMMSGMMGQGMMGHGGMGAGMMAHGMMAHGMMDPGMMGNGMGGGQLVMVPAPPLLTVADVTYNLERLLAARGNARLKVGPVTDKDQTTIIGDVVTSEGGLVERYEVDKRTGIAEMVP